MRAFFTFFSLLFFIYLSAQTKSERLQAKLDSLRVAGNYPGLSVALTGKEGKLLAFTSGFSDMEKKTALNRHHMLMQGSVGKTYVAAIALQLIRSGQLKLNEKVSAYLGHLDWFHRVPNAATITVRQIMNHTSGVMRYEFKPDFLRDLNAHPEKNWKPEELLKYVLDEKPAFAAGEDWEYSDTNYILLGMIIEKVTGKPYYELLTERILKPLDLVHTRPTDHRMLNDLSQGYAGKENEFGNKEKVLSDDGNFIINPQFEWTGGGIYSTTSDLASWGKILYEGGIADTALMLSGAVPAKLGRNTKYGLGVIIRETPFGICYGHSGFFPGYLTEMAYFPGKGICIAVQANSSDFRSLKFGLFRVLTEVLREFD